MTVWKKYNCKKDVLKNIANFTGKHLCWSLFFNKFHEKVTPAQAFFCEIYEIFKNTYFEEHVQTAASKNRHQNLVVNYFPQNRHLTGLWIHPWWINYEIQKQPSRGAPRKRCSENMQQIYRTTPMQSVISQLYWNHTSAWVFSSKFAAYFQSTFF